MSKNILLSVENLKQYFPLKKNGFFEKQLFLRANDDITIDIFEGETLGIVGESGCGKSTFGRTLLQLYKQTSGKTFYIKNGEKIDLTTKNAKELRELRSDLQMIFQDPYSSLNPRMTVGQIIKEGVIAHKIFEKNDAQLFEYIIQIMEKCGLHSYMINRYPHQFSGGQRQRIGIARSLAVKPKFVICDEAVSALDVSIQSQIINLLKELKKQEKLTYMFISHDLSVVKYISDRIGVMYLGNIVELSPTESLFSCPMHPYTKSLLDAIPTIELGKKKNLQLLEGDIPSPINPPKGCKFHTRCEFCKDECKINAPKLTEITPNHFVACHFPLTQKNKTDR